MTVVDRVVDLREVPAMTPAQLRTFDELLAVGSDRPTAQIGLAEELRVLIESGTADALSWWTERSLFLSKGQMFTALRCEGQLLANAESSPFTGMHPATFVGTVAHRTIQICHTHPELPVGDAVDASIKASCRADEKIATMWSAADIGEQSDWRMQAISRVTSFLDSWPVLMEKWTPRFEEAMQAKVGRLTLSARPDLVLGRPKPDGRQTMLLCDFKTGAIHDDHPDEAAFYALVATLRHGIPPFRSVIYSLASGEWTEPDVTAPRLREAAAKVVDATRRICETLTERREPELVAGRYCSWCPAAATCPANIG